MKKIIFSIILGLEGLSALGFGSMGNTSAGLGDSGVALTKSAWGIYYNPALLAADNRGKFGYSFGVNMEQIGAEALISTLTKKQEELDLVSIQNALAQHSKHTISLNSQNGIAIQITGGDYETPKLDQNGKETNEMISKRNPYGAFTIAAFQSFHLYCDIQESMNTDNSFKILGIALAEIPFGWGWRFETSAGDISVGAAIKYMSLSGIDVFTLNQQEIDQQSSIFRSTHTSNWFGIDLGVLYSIYGLNVGIVTKNINAPGFDLSNQKVRIMPQLRMGLAYEFAKYFALTFDMDLAPNHTFFDKSPKTQMIGAGFLVDFRRIDLRFGMMGDMANRFEQGVIFTGGINLLGFLDFAVQASTSVFEFQKRKIPNFTTLKLGGSFTF